MDTKSCPLFGPASGAVRLIPPNAVTSWIGDRVANGVCVVMCHLRHFCPLRVGECRVFGGRHSNHESIGHLMSPSRLERCPVVVEWAGQVIRPQRASKSGVTRMFRYHSSE